MTAHGHGTSTYRRWEAGRDLKVSAAVGGQAVGAGVELAEDPAMRSELVVIATLLVPAAAAADVLQLPQGSRSDWLDVRVPGTHCASGAPAIASLKNVVTPTGRIVIATKRRLVIMLQGGGGRAYDVDTARDVHDGPADGPGLGDHAYPGEAHASDGLYDLTDPANALYDYRLVSIKQCARDGWAGSRPGPKTITGNLSGLPPVLGGALEQQDIYLSSQLVLDALLTQLDSGTGDVLDRSGATIQANFDGDVATGTPPDGYENLTWEMLRSADGLTVEHLRDNPAQVVVLGGHSTGGYGVLVNLARVAAGLGTTNTLGYIDAFRPDLDASDPTPSPNLTDGDEAMTFVDPDPAGTDFETRCVGPTGEYRVTRALAPLSCLVPASAMAQLQLRGIPLFVSSNKRDRTILSTDGPGWNNIMYNHRDYFMQYAVPQLAEADAWDEVAYAVSGYAAMIAGYGNAARYGAFIIDDSNQLNGSGDHMLMNNDAYYANYPIATIEARRALRYWLTANDGLATTSNPGGIGRWAYQLEDLTVDPSP